MLKINPSKNLKSKGPVFIVKYKILKKQKKFYKSKVFSGFFIVR
jgi:hypothetical protein